MKIPTEAELIEMEHRIERVRAWHRCVMTNEARRLGYTLVEIDDEWAERFEAVASDLRRLLCLFRNRETAGGCVSPKANSAL